MPAEPPGPAREANWQGDPPPFGVPRRGSPGTKRSLRLPTAGRREAGVSSVPIRIKTSGRAKQTLLTMLHSAMTAGRAPASGFAAAAAAAAAASRGHRGWGCSGEVGAQQQAHPLCWRQAAAAKHLQALGVAVGIAIAIARRRASYSGTEGASDEAIARGRVGGQAAGAGGHRAADGCSRPYCYPRRQHPALAEPSRLAARRADILPRDTEQMAFLVV